MKRLAILLVAVGLSIAGCSNDVSYQLEYPRAQFRGDRKTVDSFSSGNEKYQYEIMEMYVRLKDGTIFKLGDLKEEKVRSWVAQNLTTASEKSITDLNELPATVYMVDGYNGFVFRDDKFVGCHLTGNVMSGPMAGAQIGATADGEFFSFPIPREDLFRAFGEPTHIRRSHFRPPN